MSVRTLGALVASLGLIASGVFVGGAAEASRPTARTKATPVVVTIDSHRTISMPTVIQPGVNEFQITSAKPSSFQIAQAAEGYTLEQAVADLNNTFEKGDVKALKRFEKNVTLFGGAPSAPDAPGVLWADLASGSYLALDTRVNRVSGFFSFTVAGAETGASMPASPKVKAIKSTTWAKKPGSIPRKGTLTFKNTALQNHLLVLEKLKPGKTMKDFVAWVEADFEGRPPLQPGAGLDSGVLSPGRSIAFDYQLPAGNYVMMCFWPDATMRGMPHVAVGMYRAIRLGSGSGGGGGGSGSGSGGDDGGGGANEVSVPTPTNVSVA